MEDSEFSTIADETPNTLSESIEEADSEFDLEVDFLEGVLTIEMPDGGEYVINKHSASQQIWLSSPVSGASHFSYDYDNEQWIDSEDNEIFEVIANELKRAANIELQL